MTDGKKKGNKKLSVDLGKRIGQELTLRMTHLGPHNLREPDLDRKIHKAGSDLHRINQIFQDVMDPLFGTKAPPKKKEPELKN